MLDLPVPATSTVEGATISGNKTVPSRPAWQTPRAFLLTTGRSKLSRRGGGGGGVGPKRELGKEKKIEMSGWHPPKNRCTGTDVKPADRRHSSVIRTGDGIFGRSFAIGRLASAIDLQSLSLSLSHPPLILLPFLLLQCHHNPPNNSFSADEIYSRPGKQVRSVR